MNIPIEVNTNKTDLNQISSEIQKNIDLAIQKSPTGGNSKPFACNWKDNEIHITYSAQLAKHYLNRNDHTSYISLGCLIKSIEVAASKFELLSIVNLSEDKLNARIKFQKQNTSMHISNLFDSLMSRSTYRGKFKKSSNKNLRSQTVQHRQAEISIDYQFNQSLTKKFKKYLTQSESYMWLQVCALKDFISEIRFFSHLSSQQQRGISSYELGISIVDQALLFLLKPAPLVLSFIRRVPILNFPMLQNSSRVLKNSNFCLFRTKELNPLSLIAVGEVAMQTWLEIESQGFKAQPMSLATIPIIDAKAGMLPDDTKEQFKKLYSESGIQVLNEQFSLRTDLKIVWMFRFGTAE